MSNVTQPRDLTERAAQGDRLAAEELLMLHYDQLRAHIDFGLPATIRAVASTEDILQETFRKAFIAIRGFKAERNESLFAWLKLIADNTVRDLLRCTKYEERSVRRPTATSDDIRGSAFLPLSEPVAGSATPMDDAQRQELVRAFQLAMQSLPDEYREAIRLCYIEGRSIEAVAAEMNRSTGSVRSICFRAKKQLQSAISRLSLYI